jgi:uncharacterized membrane protein
MEALHVYFGPDRLAARPELRKIGPGDCFAALREGFADFLAAPTHLVFLALTYAFAGVVLGGVASLADALHLVFPIVAGVALVGPFFALGLYELSRRRELGLSYARSDALVVARSPALPAILALGLILIALFAAWIASAQALYVALYGPQPPTSAGAFLNDVLTTGRGRELILFGGAIGFVFAVVALCLSVISFPLLLDRDVGLVVAIEASLRLAAENPVAVALWGFLVAALLFIGAVPLFIGLSVVFPVLGHASWRFYRRAVIRDPAREHPALWPSSPLGPTPKFHATPHSVLFPWPEGSGDESGQAQKNDPA